MKARVCKRVYWPLHFDILSKEKRKETEGKGWEWANERNNTILQARHGYGYGNGERMEGWIHDTIYSALLTLFG